MPRASVKGRPKLWPKRLESAVAVSDSSGMGWSGWNTEHGGSSIWRRMEAMTSGQTNAAEEQGVTSSSWVAQAWAGASGVGAVGGAGGEAVDIAEAAGGAVGEAGGGAVGRAEGEAVDIAEAAGGVVGEAGGGAVGRADDGQSESARSASRALSRLLREAITREPYAA
jgi:hypothetical protein